ncbi:leukemia inhibitory factor receptor-like [Engystomops pustulosus]|uniref:leukemia inhibitory factor receptor-like n=1 Tax=Engystomops pustulosus TaxID=76066 RepID=UPI003AFA0B8D
MFYHVADGSCGYTETCDTSCIESPDTDWNEGIFCHSVFNTYGHLQWVNCSWLPYKSSKIPGYKLYLVRSDHDCQVIDIQDTSMILSKNRLYIDEMATIWVAYDISDQLCVKTNNFSIVPQVNCQSPEIQHAVHAENFLIFQLDKIGQARYREITSYQWHLINVTQDMNNVSLPRTLVPETYVLQQRCLNEFCFHCKWEAETIVPHELLGAPDIIVTTGRLSPGKQRLTIRWKYTSDDYVDEYIVTIHRIPDTCGLDISFSTRHNTVHMNLSVSFFDVSVTAFNKASRSMSASVVVPPLATPEFQGKVTATYVNDTIFLTWSPMFVCDFVQISWGTSYSQMQSKIIMDNIEYYSIPGPFESMKRYTIIISLYDLCKCQDSTKETTYGLTYIYTVEGVPRTGPHNVTIKNVTKTSAVIEWEEIPEDDCLGFLLGYRISYADTLGDPRTDIFLNASNQRHYKVEGLLSGHMYEVTVSGVTVAGTGAPSAHQVIQTPRYDKAELQVILIVISIGLIISVIIVVRCCIYTLRRAKIMYYPEIPDPKHSHIGEFNIASGTKTMLMQISPSDEDESSKQLGVEVTPQTESLLGGFSIQETDTGIVQKPSNHGGPSHALRAGDYTNMTSALRVFHRGPETTNYLQHQPIVVQR